MRKLLPCCAMLILFSACAEEPGFDPRAFAYHLSCMEMGEKNWDKFVKESQCRLDLFLNAPPCGGSVEAFLNDRLVDLGNQVGDVESLKKFVAWLGLYHVWKIDLPDKAGTPLNKRRDEILKLLQDGVWAKLLEAVKKK